MSRRSSITGEMSAGALAGAAGFMVATVVAAGLERLVAPPDVRVLLEALGGAVCVAVGAPDASVAPLVGFLTAAFAALATGAVFGALVRNVRALASVAFWAVLLGGTLAVLAASASPAPVLSAAAALGHALALTLLVPLRRWLGVPYEPKLRAARPCRRLDDEDWALGDPLEAARVPTMALLLPPGSEPPDGPDESSPYAAYELQWHHG